MVNFFDADFHVVNKAALLVVEVASISPCMATLNVLIFDLTHVGFVKLLKLFVFTPWFSIPFQKFNECMVLVFVFFNVFQKLIIIAWVNNVF